MPANVFLPRRRFLGCSAALLTLGPGITALAAPQAASKRLVVIMLRGAVDGLSVVVPHGDPDYAAMRPTIALARPGEDGGVIDLDGYFGLHPALAPLRDSWRNGRLAFVHACGSPDPSRSHFDAQDYMESATPGVKTTPDGWLNRLIGQLAPPHGPTQAISVGATRPRVLSGRWPSSNLSLGASAGKLLPVDRPQVADAFARLYDGDDPLSAAFRESRQARQELNADMRMPDLKAEMAAADNGAPHPDGFRMTVVQLAGLLDSDDRIQVVFADLGGWDTHVNQGSATGQLAKRLAPLGEGLAAFTARLGPKMDDTVVLVMSEFGRTARENGNGGTDHGHGNVVWLLGGPVAGGKVHGPWPGLGQSALYQGRDLAVATDFRQVVAATLRHHMGLEGPQLAAVLPPSPAFGEPLAGLFRGTAQPP